MPVGGAEHRGIPGFSLLAVDAWRFGALRCDAETSMLEASASTQKPAASTLKRL
jgi:hypothetical protein